ncbi:MspA family porin [Nocardia flavorosea]|uniref:MspA family porin n=1 Tax=Nocardia flavorosea TaxID=53429 RepID=UPI0024552EC0|nr:MspA family porin [Nocardia flavorosea]
MIDPRKFVRAAFVAAASVGLLATGTAGADTFVPLPGAAVTETLADGTAVTLRIVGESATISPSMGATPLHRNAWVSSSAQVELSAPARSKIKPGYVVGCQVNIAGGGANSGANYNTDWAGENQSAGGSLGGNLSLGPGQAKKFYLLDLEAPDAFGSESHRPFSSIAGTSGSVSWHNSTIGLSGCAGYAQARAFTEVEVETASVKEIVTVWGQPFSLG